MGKRRPTSRWKHFFDCKKHSRTRHRKMMKRKNNFVILLIYDLHNLPVSQLFSLTLLFLFSILFVLDNSKADYSLINIFQVSFVE